jgi:hypothetical protein
MTPAETKTLDQLKAYIQIADQFVCSACNAPRPKAKLDGIHPWRPYSPTTRRLAQGRTAFYVICEDCAHKPESATRPQIEATLAKNGLFGNGKGLHRA